MTVYSVCKTHARNSVEYQILPYDLKGTIHVHLKMTKGLLHLVRFLLRCRMTEEKAKKLKARLERRDLARLKKRMYKKLKRMGYTKEQMAFIKDVVSIARPGVVMVKESINGEYTGRLSEVYL